MGLFDVVGGIAGNLLGGYLQNSATEGFQQTNIDWQREQLTHQHQWEVEDLKKAGLNPILTATHGSSAVSAGSPQGASMDLDITKMLNAVSNSALAQKQTQIAEYDAETRRISANAQKLQAKVEESKADSAIGVNESQRWLNLQNADRIQHLWPMEVAYAKANIDFTMQKIINSIIETQAKQQYLDRAGRAQLMIGSGAQMQGQAALQNASTQRMMAETMEKNGVSQRMINDVMSGKLNQDILESQARLNKVVSEDKVLNWNLQKDLYHNPIAGKQEFNSETAIFGFGEYLSNAIGLGSLIK